MSLPVDFITDGLAPHIIIYDNNWKKQLEYVHESIDENGARDFNLKSWSINGGVNSDVGNCNIIIDDKRHEHTLQIKPNWLIRIYLYGTQLNHWFTGVIYEPGLVRTGYGEQVLNIQAYGYGEGLSKRFISITKAAYEEADGIESDADGITISELAKFCLHNDALLIPPGDPNLTSDIEDIDIKLGSFSKENQSQGVVLAELANIAGAIYGVNPDLSFYFRSLDSQSKFIVTNRDLGNQNQDNLYVIRNQEYFIRENQTKKAYTNLIGLDVTIHAEILPDNGGTDDAVLSVNYIGFPILGNDEILGLEVYMKPRFNTGLFNWRVTSNNWESTQVASGVVSAATMAALPASGGWVRLGDIPSSDNPRRLWFDDFSSSRILVIYNGQGAGSYKTSAQPYFNWDILPSSSGTLRMRSTQETAVILKAQNTTLKKTHRDSESMEYLSEKPSGETATTLFEGILNAGAKIRQIYAPLVVSANQNLPPLGKRVRFIDDFNGLETNPICIGYDIRADYKTKLMAINMNLELEELI